MNKTLYKDGNDFKTSYTNIIQHVLDIVRSGKKVVYCSQGSPVFLSYTSRQLFNLSLKDGFKALIVPGVSSFECILSALASTDNIYDVQIYNCDCVVNNQVTPQTNSLCLLFNLSTYANSTINKEVNRLEIEKLEKLKISLFNIYKKNLALKIIMLNLDGTSTIIKSTLNLMIDELKTVSSGVTLFLPASV